jgi:hypothetical protein
MKSAPLWNLAFLALFLCRAPLAVAAGETPATPSLATLDAQLLRGEWEPARAAALALIQEDLSRPEPAPLAGAVARLALAEAGLGREADALWHWQAAQNLDRSALSPEALAAYGAPGALLARHPLRRADEAPPGLRVLRSEEAGVRSGRRLAGSIPALSAATAAVPGPPELRLQAVITADGRLTEPVVQTAGSPGATWEILEGLRGWRYEPARKENSPVAVFRAVTIKLPAPAPAGDPARTGIARVEDLLRAGRWAEARESSRELWREALGGSTVTRKTLADLLALRAVAEAGLGLEPEAVCRWQAAQYLEPAVRSTDLSAYGPAGRLLEKHPREEGEFTGRRKAKVDTKSTPEYPKAALRALSRGKVVLGATLGRAGAVRQPLVLRVEQSLMGTVMVGLTPRADSQASWVAAAAKLLAFSALDALCDLRLRSGGSGDPQQVVSLPFSAPGLPSLATGARSSPAYGPSTDRRGLPTAHDPLPGVRSPLPSDPWNNVPPPL